MDDQSKRNTQETAPFLTGQLLLAMPGITDSRFQKAVIFLCAHDSQGAMGLVLNNRLQGIDFGNLLEQINIPEATQMPSLKPCPVFSGGPVENSRGFILHSTDFRREETVAVNDFLGITGTIDALKDIAEGNGPSSMRFLLGYSGWSAGQLDDEIQKNVWLTVPASKALVFDTPPEAMWSRALSTIGIDPALLSTEAGRA